MNYIKHLTGFFEKVATDKTLNPTHVSLYIALFQFWNCNRFKNPISINRDEVMRISKISSKATYHKCLRNLHNLGYINYEPSYNPFKGSHVILFNFSDYLKPIPKSERKPKNELLFEQVNEQALNKLCTSSGTGTEHVPYINNTNSLNNKNILNLNKQSKNFEEKNNLNFKTEKIKKEKSSAKKEKEMFEAFGEVNQQMHQTFADYKAEQTENSRQKKLREKKKGFVEPAIEEIKIYFQKNNFPEQEAQKFFNYFKSVGWLVGGKTPMVDWRAGAQNWMINALKFVSSTEIPNRAKQLNIANEKDYSEPL